MFNFLALLTIEYVIKIRKTRTKLYEDTKSKHP